MTEGAITSFRGPYRWLSNFWSCGILCDDGLTYPSSEHAYQLYKTLNLDARRYALALGMTCGQVKRYGSMHQLRPDWETVKLSVMEDIVRRKFTQNEDLKQKLLATGNMGLLEGNTWGDTFWGFCNGVGQNHLGKILMRVRALLREEQ